MEKNPEIDNGNLDFGARIYDGRIGRWWAVDPLIRNYPDRSSYVGIGNNPILFTDPNGKILRDKDGNIIVTFDENAEVRTFGRPEIQTDGTTVLMERTYKVGHIYTNSGNPVEVLILTSVTYTQSKGSSIIKKFTNTQIPRKQMDVVADCHGLTFTENKLWIDNYGANGSGTERWRSK